MPLYTHVQGGTGAGTRKFPKPQNKTDWTCPKKDGGCGKSIKYYWTSCPNCGHPRPER